MWSETPALPAAEIHELPTTIDTQLLIELQDYALIVISGPDGEKFLQGQTTCDFRRLTQNHWLRGAHCNAKGRMHSSFVAARIDDQRIGLRVHNSVAEQALAALQKYIVFSKAQAAIEPALLLGVIAGPEGLNLPFSLPDTGNVCHTNGSTALRLDDQRMELWLTDDSAADLPAALPGHWAAAQCWHTCNLLQGITEVKAASYEMLLPQELNYQLIDAISFEKGCYTGQEIVARMHYRGKIKKHLYLAEVTLIDVEPAFETEVEVDGKIVGKVIDWGKYQGNRWLLLVLVQDDAWQQKANIKPASQSILQWQSLPYAIPNETS